MAEPMFDFAAFEKSLGDSHPPLAANTALRALWHDANDRNESAHRAAHAEDSLSCMRVRAYLYRKEGKTSEARIAYWKAGVSPWEGTSQSEWLDIAQSICIEFPVASAYGA